MAKATVQQIADNGVRHARSPLPYADRIGRAFGANHNIGGVRTVIGGAATAASRALGTQGGYATRERVALVRPPSLRIAAHEAAHIIQQRSGLDLSGGVGRAGDAHERHADAVADRVVQGRSAGDLLQAYAGPLAKTAGGTASTPTGPLPGAGAPVVQLWNVPQNAPWMLGGKWRSGMKYGRVAWMVAEDLELKAGQQVGAGANGPTAKPASWGQLKGWKMIHTNKKGAGDHPGYVRMHMLSDRLGGPGDDKENLAPGTNGMNQRHFARAEKKLIDVLDNGGEIMRYKVVANYQGPSKKLKTAKGKAAWQNTLDSLNWTASYKAGGAAKKTHTHGTIHETKKLDTKPNWTKH